MTLQLRILVPDAVLVDTPVIGVQAADATGRFGIRPGHEPFVTVLVPSLLVYTTADGERYAAVDGGMLLLEGDQLSVVSGDAVVSDRLDEMAARTTGLLEARKLQERQAAGEFRELQTALVERLGRVGDRH